MFDHSFKVLEKTMKETAGEQATLAHNLANINNPNYKAMEFDKELGKAIERLDKKKLTLEEEMAALSENSLKYSGLVKLMTGKMGILKTIASQGRR